MTAVFLTCPDCGRYLLGQHDGSHVYAGPCECRADASP